MVLRRSRGFVRAWMCVLLLLASVCAVSPTFAQTPGQFCFTPNQPPSRCFDTLDKAEQALRALPENAFIAQALEADAPRLNPDAHTAEYLYRVKDQPTSVLNGPSYYQTNSPNIISGGFGCAQSADPNLPSWCANEAELIERVMTFLREARPDCSHSPQQLTADRPQPYAQIDANTGIVTRSYGEIEYGAKVFTTTRTCAGVSTVFTFRIYKKETFQCPAGFTRLGDSVPNDGVDDRSLPALCRYGSTRIVTGPIQQVASCKASAYPCYPATGEKARVEPDFSFAGRSFARYYHSLRQLRNNFGFGIGWTHSFSDRIFTRFGATNVALVDETGAYERFVPIDATRYRGENSTGQVLESIATGAVRWRLRLPGGEIREFDAAGQLIQIRTLADPRRDIGLSYVDGLLTSLTDGQGRRARFAYSSGKLLSRIDLPDGAVIHYGYDADRNLTTVDDSEGRLRRYHYAEAGKIGDSSQRNHLTGITAETGERFLSVRYDARGRVIESRAHGTPEDVTTVTYDTETQATVATAPGTSRTYTIQPSVYRRITAVNTPGQGTATQAFDAQGRLQSRTDHRNLTTQYEYAANSAYRSAIVEAVGTPEQRREETTRDATAQQVTERRTLDAQGVVRAKTAWTYNANEQVLTVTATDPATSATRTATTAYCDATDVTTANSTCPLLGLLKQIDGPRPGASDVVTYHYRANDEASCATSPTTCTYRKGDLWKVVNALGHTSEILSYDGAGRVRSAKDANGLVTDLEYDARGALTAAKQRGTDDTSESDDRIMRIEYRADGTTKKIIQADGSALHFDYDAAQRLTAIVDGEGHALRYTLSAAGQRVKEEIFDNAGSLRRTLSRSYNTLGQLQSISMPHPNPAVTTPATTTYQYDAEGSLDLSTDALGRQSDHDYDSLGRLRRTLHNATAAAGAPDRAETRFEYDALDRTTQVVDPKGLSTSYAYNGFGDVTSTASPDTGTTTNVYDGAGNRIRQTDANGKVTEYAYDALNRTTAVQYPQEPSLNVAYVYDAAQSDCGADESYTVGRLSRMTDASGSTTFCYNRYGDLTRKVQRTPGQTLTLQWTYAANGQLQAMTYPDGSVVDYLYDSQGNLVEIGVGNERPGSRRQLLRNARYHPFGPVAQWTYGNGRTIHRTLNRGGQPGIVQDTAIDGIDLGYEFDAAGNLKVLRNGNQTDPPKRSYEHDGLNRLTAAKDAQAILWQSYQYDKTGNRTASGRRETVNTSNCSGQPPGEPCPPGPTTTQWITRSYGTLPTDHRVLTIGNTQRNYDAAGNTIWIGPRSIDLAPPDEPPEHPLESAAYSGTEQTSIGQDDGDPPPGIETKTFVYNAANRMASVSREDELIMSYRYNGAGERVYRSGSNEVVHTLFDPQGHWIGDYDANGQAIQQAIWLGDLPVGLARNRGGSIDLQYVQADALGTPRVVIDPSRDAAVWRWDLAEEPFGESEPEQDPDGDGMQFVLDMRYPGQQYDSATGLNYNYFRDYDPSTGRYKQPDPIGLNGGISLYGYAGGNSLTKIDPLGLQQRPPNPFGTSYHTRNDMPGVRSMPPTEHVFHDAWGMAEIISNGGMFKAYDEDGDGDTHCAELIKHRRVFDAVPTWEWRAGRPVVPGMNIQAGTAIATFDANGRYPAGPVKHAAIFIGFSQDGSGILVLDQWDRSSLQYRDLPWQYQGTNPHSNYVNSASNFSTIVW